MRQKGGCNIVRIYADAVIAHADRFKPAAFCFYRHGGCARIYRVFKQFFYDRCRPFHNLARSYAVCRIAIQHMNTAHFFPFLSFALICKSYNAFIASIGVIVSSCISLSVPIISSAAHEPKSDIC